MKVRDVMSTGVEVVRGSDSVKKAAEVMENLDVGVLPVADEQREVGMITDRDIVTRCLANDLNPQHTSVGEIMSKGVKSISQDASLDEAVEEMENYRIRRLLVRNASGDLTGVISLGDIARHSSPSKSGQALHEISEP